MAITGNQATITFQSLSMTVLSIQPRSITRDGLEDTDISTTGYRTFVPADLMDPGGVDAEIFLDTQEMDDADGIMKDFVDADVASIVVTLDPTSYVTTDPNITGTGFIDSFEVGEISNNNLIRANIGFRFDGKTGPTFTEGTA